MFITTKKTHTIAPFDPPTTRDNLAKADAAIAFAAKIKNWPLLEEAIDAKIADQEEFVRWWAENVQRQGGLWSVFSGQWSIDSVERVTGITKQQVSLWRKWLEDKPKYRERMLLEARHADTPVAWRDRCGSRTAVRSR